VIGQFEFELFLTRQISYIGLKIDNIDQTYADRIFDERIGSPLFNHPFHAEIMC